MLVSGFATNSILHFNLLPVVNATPPPFGIDGTPLSNASRSVSSLFVNGFSTTYANDTVIVFALSANTSPYVFLNVSDSDSLNWNLRLNYTWSNDGQGFGTVAEYWAFANSSLSSDQIIVTQNVTDTLSFFVFAISGANPYAFDDGNGSTPIPAINTGEGSSPGVSFQTYSQTDIIFGFLGTSDDPGKTTGSGFTDIERTNVAPAIAGEYMAVNGPQSVTANYALSADNNWTMVGDAVAILDNATPYVKHVVLIPMENVNESSILKISSLGEYDSYIRHLATDTAYVGPNHIKSGSFTNYYGAMYPSTPNYIALTSGGTQGYPTTGTWYGSGGPYVCKNGQCPDIPANGWNVSSNVASLFSSISKSTVYAENAPTDCSLQEDNLLSTNTLFNTQYVGHHTAYPYFLSSAKKYCLGNAGNSVNGVGYDSTGGYDYSTATITLGQFYSNVTKSSLPAFSMLVPDLCNDMHTCAAQSGKYNYEPCPSSYNTAQCELQAGDNFTKAAIKLLEGNSALWSTTLVIIVWDTGNCLTYYDHGGTGCSTSVTHKNGGGNVAIIFASGASAFKWTKEGATSVSYNHYFTANTIIDALGISADIGGGAHEKTTGNYVSIIF
jgi:hypothetical protein